MKLYRCPICGSVAALDDGEYRGQDGRTCAAAIVSKLDGQTMVTTCGGRLQELTTPVGIVKQVGHEGHRA